MATISDRRSLYAEKRSESSSHDWGLIASALLLYLVGIIAIGSVSFSHDKGLYFYKQLFNGGVGVLVFLIFSLIKLEKWQKYANSIYVLNILMLVAVLLIGDGPNGVKRWIDVGPIQFQPSELTKVFVAITLGAFYAKHKDNIKSPWVLLGGALHILPIVALVYKQPHNGAALALLLVGVAAAIYADVPAKFFPAAIVAVVALMSAAWFVPNLMPAYAKLRITSTIDSMVHGEKDLQGTGFQQYMAELAIGNGGPFGQGLGKGDQKDGKTIPEQHTDFIFSVIGEEGGFFGSVLVLILFGFFFFRVWLVTFRAQSTFARTLAGSLFAILAIHTVINLAMILQLGPVVGLWLPFLSYGGTALWMCLAAVALLNQAGNN